MSTKYSPKKSSRSITPESLDLAKQILEGKLDITKIDSLEAPSCLQGLQALRHRSMIEKNKRKMQKCDSLITELNNIINSQKDSASIKSASSGNSNFNLNYVNNLNGSISTSVLQNNQIEISDEEMIQINSIIQSLLNGCEIDSIDSSSLPKLEMVLKMRKAKAIDESDYQSAKILDKNIQSLSKYRQPQKNTSPIRRKEIIAEREARINILYDQLNLMKNNFAEEKDRIKTEREESLNSLFAQNEKEVNDLLEEKTNIMMGVGFKPSKRLIELRQKEVSMAKMSYFDEASELKKRAEDLEIQERTEFDRKSLKNFEIKEKEQRKKQNARISTSRDFWKSLLERTEARFNSDIQAIENEIESIIAKIEEISGEKYNRNTNESTDFSGLSFNDNNNQSKQNQYNDYDNNNNNNNNEEEDDDNIEDDANFPPINDIINNGSEYSDNDSNDEDLLNNDIMDDDDNNE